MLLGDGSEGNKFANAGVGENNVYPSLHLRDCLIEPIEVVQLGNISLDAIHIAADCLNGLCQFPLSSPRDEDIGALFDKKFCSREPNPLCSAGYKRGLAFELFRHCPSPPAHVG